MAGFADPFAPKGGPPPSVPKIELPPPDFRAIGGEIFEGIEGVGGLSDFWKKFFQAAVSAVLHALGYTIGLVGWFAGLLVKGLVKIEDAAQFGFDALASAAVSDLFGADIPIDARRGAGRAGGRQVAAKSIGDAVLRGLFGGIGGSSQRQLEPGTEGAQRYLTTTFNMALEGWLEGWIVEALSLGQIERFGDLDDKLAQVLGLSRLTSLAVRPAAEVLVATPLEWHLNKLYRPRLLSAAEVERQVAAGDWTEERGREELARQGYAEDRITAIFRGARRYLSVADLDYLYARGGMADTEVITQLKAQGFSEPIARALQRIAEDRRLDVWRRRIADEALAAYVRRDIDETRFRQLLTDSRIPDFERSFAVVLGGLRREFATRPMSMTDWEQAVKRGIRTRAEFRGFLATQGYSPADQLTLELLLMTDIRDAEAAARERTAREQQRAVERTARDAARQKRRDEIAAELAVRELSLAQFEALVRRGLRTADEYRQFLRSERYAEADVVALADHLLAGVDAARQTEIAREQARAAGARRKLNVGAYERAVRLGVAGADDFRAFLSSGGFTVPDAALLVDTLVAEIKARGELLALRVKAQAAAAVRQVSLADLEDAARRGLVTLDVYRARLVTLGYPAQETDLLVALVNDEITERAAAQQVRTQAQARLRAARLSLPELERAVLAGLRSIAEYQTMLEQAGLTVGDVATIVALLQQRIDSAARAAATRAAARAKATERRISLADTEAAVRAGLLTVDHYRGTLKRLAFPPEDMAILAALLVDELARDAAARKLRAAVPSPTPQKRITLADTARSVRRLLRPPWEYRNALLAAGYSETDTGTLVALLQAEIDADAALARKRAQAEARARERRISLPDFEGAVKAGLSTIADYQRLLVQTGFPAEDVALLVGLLAVELARGVQPAG